MLTCLHIKNFAIADNIELDLSDGLSIITGETGAGKSIIIKALGLVLGQRTEPGVVKHGCKRAEIQASFDISNCEAVSSLLVEQELDEDHECQLRRVINAESGSKAYINGRMVTAGMLRKVGELLMDIHGQHEHQSLLRADTQRELLDKYAGLNSHVSQIRHCYHKLQLHITQLNQLRSDFARVHEKLDFLQFQVDELSQFAPQADEWSKLYNKHQRIHHQAELAALVQNAEQALMGNELDQASLSSQLGKVISELDRAQAITSGFKDVNEILREAQTLLIESESSLRHVAESIEFDEDELEQIEQRYATYMEFARKHRVDPEQLYSTYQTLLTELDRAENPEQNEQALLSEIQALGKQYAKLADTISRKRVSHARKLSKAITLAIQSLAMEGGEFNIVLQNVTGGLNLSDADKLISGIGRETGMESISFEVSTNTGMPGLPLSRVASGGELSRISLAIQLILSDLETVHSLVFDEVDVGVGGKTAAIIGKMLAQLAQNRQILCITHLPQVAAYGTRHYHVNKQQGKQVQLSIEALDDSGKINEIARMVGGETISDESLAHARGLIADSKIK